MCVTSWNRDTFSLVDNVQHLYLPILSEIGAITLVKVFLVYVPQPKLCRVTTHLSVWCGGETTANNIYLESFLFTLQVSSPQQTAFIPDFSQISATLPCTMRSPCSTGTWYLARIDRSQQRTLCTWKAWRKKAPRELFQYEVTEYLFCSISFEENLVRVVSTLLSR